MSWVKSLESHLSSNGAETVPDGWMTARQIAEDMGKSISRTQHIITDQVRSGWLEKKKFRIQVGDRSFPVPHYRPAQKRK